MGWAAPIAIVALAAFLRMYRLDSVPPAFSFDEAAHAVDALDILAGHHFLFSPKLQGVESFFMYCVAGAFYLMGPSPFAQRLVSALIGIATVAATYLMVREMFREEGERKRNWLGVFTAAGLATSFWHLNYSRIGLEVSMTPFFAALSFYFLWRGLHRDRIGDYILSGVFMGLNSYTHLPARFMPIPVVIFFVTRFLLKPSQGWRALRPLVIIGLAALVTYAPMGIYFLLHPADFFGRAAITSIFNPAMHGGDFWGTLWRSLSGTFGAFGFTSDPNWLANLPGKPILNLPLAALFWLGVAITLVRIRRGPYLFVFLAWFTLLLPAVITPERTPHYSRMMITACVVHVFPAMALVELGGVLEWVLKLGKNLWFALSAPELRYSVGYPEFSPAWQKWAAGVVRVLAYIAVSLLFAWTGFVTYRDYFDVWAKSDAHYLEFHGYAVELAEHIRAESNPDAIYIIPRDIRAGEFYHHYTLDFFLRDGAPYWYVPMQEENVPRLLTEACRGKRVVRLIRWKMDKHREADPKQFVDMLLEKFGERESTQSFPAYDIVTYRLPSAAVDFTRAPESVRLGIDFGDKIRLEEAAYGNATSSSLDESHDVPSSGTAWLTLRWQKIATFDEDYRVSIVLTDAAGHIIHHQDRDLIHKWHTRTGLWHVGEPVSDYHLVTVPAGTPPGVYAVNAVVYDARTMERLPVTGHSTTLALLGHIRVRPPTQLPAEGVPVPQHSVGLVLDGIELVGFDLDLSSVYAPGRPATLTLHWRVKQAADLDLQVALLLESAERQYMLRPAVRLLGDGYPTTRWLPGQYWRSIQDLRIPAEARAGRYTLKVRLSRADADGVLKEVALGQVDIGGRARRFDMPPVGRPLSANLSRQVLFLGYDLKAHAVKPGEKLELTLYWQALQEMDVSYTVFVHLLNGDSRVQAQRDFIPGDGQTPTSGWLKGEILSDVVRLDLPSDMPAGEYTLEIGLYDARNGQRLQVVNEAGQVVGDRVVLEQVRVK